MIGSFADKIMRKKHKGFITIVSGLPRSGTSMMMQILEAGGMEILTDNIRKADKDNPRGYYELEIVKKIARDSSWLEDAYGKCFKMVSALLYHLPQNHEYRIIFMRRRLEEMLKSQRVMLERLGRKGGEGTDAEMIRKFTDHLQQIEHWLGSQLKMKVMYLEYGEMLRDPGGKSEQLRRFLGIHLDEEKMIRVVDPSLRNQRVIAKEQLG